MGSDNGKGGNLIRIGDLARRAGTTMRTIRYYEQRGLIEPVRRTKGGFRLYQEGEVRKLHLIRSLQLLDIPLSQVKAFFDARRCGQPAAEIAPALQGILREQLGEMERRIAQYRAMEESVLATINILDACSSCPYEPSPAVCPRCPVLAGRTTIPPHMQVVIASGEREIGAGDVNTAPVVSVCA
jgi:MerR family Zn(II)-responsive transcriptional regulator of zntA